MVGLQPQADSRLRTRSEYLRVQHEGRKLRGQLLLAIYATRQMNSARVGLTVSRKVGNAVRRNRVKRRLRALWQLETAHLRLVLGDIVFIALPSASHASYAVLRREFLWLLDKAASRASRAS